MWQQAREVRLMAMRRRYQCRRFDLNTHDRRTSDTRVRLCELLPMHSKICLLLCTFPLNLILGCGGGTGEKFAIDGVVSYAGEPIKNGSLTFRSADPSSPEVSAAIVDGAYRVPAQLGPK